VTTVNSSEYRDYNLDLRRRPVTRSRSYPIATVSSSRSSRIASFSSKGKADDSARVCRLCLRQAARSSGDNEFREAGLFTFILLTLLRFVIVLLLVLVIGLSEENFDHNREHEDEKTKQATFETIFTLVVSVRSERQDSLYL